MQEAKKFYIPIALLMLFSSAIFYIIGLTTLLPISDSIHDVMVDIELSIFGIGAILFAIGRYNKSKSILSSIIFTALVAGGIALVTYVTFWIVAFSYI